MINVVIGSWGSYNACNERALGSKWLHYRSSASSQNKKVEI